VWAAKISFCHVITDKSVTRKQLRVQNKKISQSGKLLLYGYSYVPWDIQQCWQVSCLKDQQSALNNTTAFWTTSILVYAKQNHRHIRDAPLPGHISSQTLKAAYPHPAYALQTHPACILHLLSSKQRSLEKVLSEWWRWGEIIHWPHEKNSLLCEDVMVLFGYCFMHGIYRITWKMKCTDIFIHIPAL